MNHAYCEVENTDPSQHQRWLDKHGFKPGEDGTFLIDKFEGKEAVTTDVLFENIKKNVSSGWYEPLYTVAYDERVFVMICGGPSLENHLDEVRAKSLEPEKYCVVCSNMTADYLMANDIRPHVHFILDPQEKKRFDVKRAIPEINYWINAGCAPSVFETLKDRGVKPFIYLAEFESDGKAIQAVKESLPPGYTGMMSIQGGTMAGLRAINLADALGFRTMEYYGFDATVQVKDGKARPYAYDKKRGEAIITITCDRCTDEFDTTLIFQKQVNEFILWRSYMPWMDIRLIGGGLIAHYNEHYEHDLSKKKDSPLRFTSEYRDIQKELHAKETYGTTGHKYMPTIFHGISQLVKRHGHCSVLDYGSASGDTMKFVREHMWVPPSVTDRCYDPFIDEFSNDPESADFVICTDVMEHVEPDCTKAVLDHLASLTKRILFLSIALKPALKFLSDGRNAHINQRSGEFWMKEIKKRFIVSEAKITKDGEDCLIVAQAIDDVRREMKKQ